MRLELIDAGTFTMGSNEPYAEFEGERPAHEVTLTRPFYIGIYEVTQHEFQTVMGFNPSSSGGDNYPVTSVSWDEAVAFCNRLSEQTGDRYRLPTDAEWEYACRAGTHTRFFWGDGEGPVGDYAWFSRNSGSAPRPVGQKLPNAWGLHDMAGNVEEWVSDLYGLYSSSPQTDPTGPSEDIWGGTSGHVLRGGNMTVTPRFLQSCWRHGHDGGQTSRGFRVVRETP